VSALIKCALSLVFSIKTTYTHASIVASLSHVTVLSVCEYSLVKGVRAYLGRVLNCQAAPGFEQRVRLFYCGRKTCEIRTIALK